MNQKTRQLEFDRLAWIINNIDLGILYVDERQQLQFLNQAIYKYFELDDSKQFIGLNLETFFKEITSEAVELVSQPFEAQSIYLEFDEFVCHVLPDLLDEKPVGFLLIIKPIHEKVPHHSHNEITKLPNRALYIDYLKQAIARAKRHQTKLALFYLDVDRFSHINDMGGYEVGDQFLLNIAQNLIKSLRNTDIVSHFGGNTFAVLIEDINDNNSLRIVAEKISKVIERPLNIKGVDLTVTASIGISIYPEDGGDFESLLKAADVALNHAKSEGGNTYQFYRHEMNQVIQQRAEIELDLHKALEKGQFEVFYQPVLAMKSRKIVGAEALLRWRHPEHGMLPPVQFIPIIEETGLIITIGEWVLRTASSQAHKWHLQGYTDFRIAVNLSAKQIYHPNFEQTIVKILDETKIKPNCLDLELTESLLIRNTENCINIMQHLKSLGLRLSIDDFGTGYSSLAYLQDFPLDILKIDRAFVQKLHVKPQLPQMIIQTAHLLGLEVIAEGVETEDQFSWLKEQGCDEMQGYLISPPVPAAEFEELLKKINMP